MANLRDIRNRITSVNNTQQITKAMKMVAAAKLRKAQNRMIETRPYAGKMKEVVARLVNNSSANNQLLKTPEQTERILLIVVGSDRGLCGGFNNNLFKVVEYKIQNAFKSFHESGNLDLICIGKKSEAYFKKRNYSVINSYPGFFDKLNYQDTIAIMQKSIGWFVDGNYDAVHVAYNEFKSVITQHRVVEQVLPLNAEKLSEGIADDFDSGIDYIFEPDSEQILDELLPLHVNLQMWKAVLESNASEQGARMAAMDNATENAKDLERELRLKYNQARQSAITTEISEIVSGAQALSD